MVTAVKNALARTRSGAVKAVKAPARGATWTGRRIRSAGGEVAQGVRWAFGGAGRGVRRGLDRAGSALEGPRDRIAETADRARERPRYAIAIASAVLVGVAWIAWAIYVTASHGATAGLGVLITWPVLLGALALVAAPVVLTVMLVQRHRDSTPAIAGAPVASEPPERKVEKKPKAEKKPEPEAEEEKPKEPEAEEDPAASSA